MSRFSRIKEALEYIDLHLNEDITYETVAETFHFSPFYFHRMFQLIVGKSITAHIRQRRLMKACTQLAETRHTLLSIGVDCGYHSAQAFSRAFKQAFGITLSEYRNQGTTPRVETVDEMIIKFTNRIKGGIDVNPTIIKRNTLLIAGASGDGDKTGEVWNAFEALCQEKPIPNKLSENGHEIRLYRDGISTVHVGYPVTDEKVDPAYTVFRLPPSQYASFDVYVEKGYDSENGAMVEWLAGNAQSYKERLLGDAHFCVEYYDERFHGSEAGSIVEIWVPIEKA